MKKLIKPSPTAARKAVAILLIFLMLLTPELLIGAWADGEWDTTILVPEVLYDGNPIENDLSVTADAEFIVSYLFTADFTTLASGTEALTIAEPLIPKEPGMMYPITIVHSGADELYVGYVTVDIDSNVSITFYDAPSFKYEEYEAVTADGLNLNDLTMMFTLPCVFDQALLPAIGETIEVTSNGDPISLLLSEPPTEDIVLPAPGTPIDEIVDGFTVVVYRFDEDAQEYVPLTITNPPTTLEIGDKIKIEYNFSVNEGQAKVIQALIAKAFEEPGRNQFYLCDIPLPDGLASGTMSVYAGEGESRKKYAEIIVNEQDNTIDIRFCGDLWTQPGNISMSNATIVMEFQLDEEWFEERDDKEIRISDNISFPVNVPEPVPVTHTLVKTCTGYDPATRTFTWQITFTPDPEHPMTGPVTFTDTLSDTHSYIAGSMTLNVGGVPTALDIDESTLGVVPPDITYMYCGPTNAGAIVLTYSTLLNYTEIIEKATVDSVAGNTVNVTWPNMGDGESYTASAEYTVTPANKTLLTKIAVSSENGTTSTTTINGNDIFWRITINTYNLPIDELYMHDLIPPGLTLDATSVKVKLPNGNALIGWSVINEPEQEPGYTGFKLALPKDANGKYYATYIVTLKTKVNDDYLAKSDANGSVDPKFQNKAWLTYKWLPGYGDGPDTTHRTPDISTGLVSVTSQFISKTGTYDAATHRITWTITVNPRKLNVTSGKVTDIIPAGQKYVPFDETTPIKLITDSTYKSGTLSIFSVEDNKLVVDVGVLGRNTARFQFQTEVLDKAQYANNATAKTYYNGQGTKDVMFDGYVDIGLTEPVRVTDYTRGTASVSSTVLAKTGAYIIATGEVEWTVVVNHNKMPMSNVTLTDTIPQYQSYVPGSVTFNPAYTPAETPSAVKNANGTSTLTIKLGEYASGQQVTVKYRTKVDVDNDPQFKNSASITLNNTVTMTRNDYDPVTVPATVTVSNWLLKKNGNYVTGEHKIAYRVEINPQQLNLQGMELVDSLPPGLQLDVHSVKLCPAAYNDSGVLVPGAPIAGGYLTNNPGETPENPSNFIIKLPASNKGQSYILTYECYVLYTKAASYANNIEFTGIQIESSIRNVSYPTSLDAIYGYGDYYIRDDVGSITIIKRDGSTRGALEGMKFYLFTTDASGAQLEVGDKTTDATGKVKFENLTPGKRYWLVEEDASGVYPVANARVVTTAGMVRLSDYGFTPPTSGNGRDITLTINNYKPSVLVPQTIDVPPDEPTDDPTDDPTGDPTDDPTGTPTDDPTDGTTDDQSDETDDAPPPPPVIATPIPGSPEYPPVPVGTILVETDDGDFIEIGEDGVPLGTWHYDDEEEIWIFEPHIPLAVPQTGDSQLAPFAMAAFILSMLGAAVLTLRSCFGLLKKKR